MDEKSSPARQPPPQPPPEREAHPPAARHRHRSLAQPAVVAHVAVVRLVHLGVVKHEDLRRPRPGRARREVHDGGDHADARGCAAADGQGGRCEAGVRQDPGGGQGASRSLAS